MPSRRKVDLRPGSLAATCLLEDKEPGIRGSGADLKEAGGWQGEGQWFPDLKIVGPTQPHTWQLTSRTPSVNPSSHLPLGSPGKPSTESERATLKASRPFCLPCTQLKICLKVSFLVFLGTWL